MVLVLIFLFYATVVVVIISGSWHNDSVGCLGTWLVLGWITVLICQFEFLDIVFRMRL